MYQSILGLSRAHPANSGSYFPRTRIPLIKAREPYLLTHGSAVFRAKKVLSIFRSVSKMNVGALKLVIILPPSRQKVFFSVTVKKSMPCTRPPHPPFARWNLSAVMSPVIPDSEFTDHHAVRFVFFVHSCWSAFSGSTQKERKVIIRGNFFHPIILAF